MKRDIWLASKSFVNGVQCLNALFCDDGEGDLSSAENEEMAIHISSKLSIMQIEDAIDVLKEAEKVKKSTTDYKLGLASMLTELHQDLRDESCKSCQSDS